MIARINHCLRQWFFVVAFVVLFTQAHGAESASLHAIYIVDTHSNIAKSCSSDLRNCQQVMRNIAFYTGLSLKENIFTGEECYAENALSRLRDLDVGKNDTIFFYFSGHGYRTKSKTDAWPMLCTIDDPYDRGLDFADVIEVLQGKRARLVLAAVDCCNNYIDIEYSPEQVTRRGMDLSYFEWNAKKLFLESKGFIAAMSSDVGQTSTCYSSGGCFTNTFLSNLNWVLLSEGAEWERVFHWTSVDMQNRPDTYQRPVFLCELQ